MAEHDDRGARERVARVEGLLDELESLPDAGARETATELVQALLDLYGEALARIVSLAGGLPAAAADDELVGHLLLLHGLHPVALETRVRGALREVRPYLESHGGDVELLGVEGSVVRLALRGSCSGCPSSTATLKLAIEAAIHEAAPDVEQIVAEGAAEAAPVAAAPAGGLIQLEVSDAVRRPPAAPEGAWTPAGALGELDGGPLLRDVDGEALLFVRLDGRPYAYRPACPVCGASLADGALSGDRLACPGCGLRYDVRLAGRCLDGSDAHLEPVPLLVDDGGLVRVALGAAA